MTFLTFKELRSMIIKCCSTKVSEDFSDKFSFTLNFYKLENMFKQKKTKFHIMSFFNIGESYKPTVTDIQFISEYINKNDNIDTIFDGKSEMFSFMIYSKENEEGDISFIKEGGEDITDKELFASVNGGNEGLVNMNLIKDIIKGCPVYRILIIRTFDDINDRFIYNVYIRSNHAMQRYYKILQTAEDDIDTLADDNTDATDE